MAILRAVGNSTISPEMPRFFAIRCSHTFMHAALRFLKIKAFHRDIAKCQQPLKLRALFLMLGVLFISNAHAERIKDLASINGVRTNQLLGYGLVVGLDGTGDSTSFTGQTFRTFLDRFGITTPVGVNPGSKNVAAVAVHADLPPFAKIGQTIDITVSSLGNAKSLRGGTLIFTPLKGADNHVYAVAQGNLVVGGLGVSGEDGSKLTVNVPVVGRIPNGASVEKTLPSPFSDGQSLTYNLFDPDFTTATRLAESINLFLGKGSAHAIDGSSVEVQAPINPSDRVEFVAAIENLDVERAEGVAKIIVNSRTGTIVIGRGVRVRPAAITHGNLSVSITENKNVSQPSPFAGGKTQVTAQSSITVTQQRSRMFLFDPGASLDDIVRAVNLVGTAPGDLMAILEALKQAGALSADLEII